jgi:flagellar basal-body rod protein FlgF
MKVMDSLNAAMKNHMFVTETITNNLTNANSYGFKKALFSLASRGDAETPSFETRIDESQGPLVETGNPLDFAIDGKGYFAIQTDAGLRFTRNGCFKLNPSGELVTQNNQKVMGKKGPVFIQGGSVELRENGDLFVDGRLADTLKIVTFPSDLAKNQEGSSLLACAQESALGEFKGRVCQHFLESSNVNALEEMVSLVDKYRVFQTLGKIVQTQDDLYSKVVMLNSR